jgi:hypothetical protein
VAAEEFTMPHLDAKALESDAEGLDFLRTVLRPERDLVAGRSHPPRAGEPGPLDNTTLQILKELAAQQTIVTRLP